MGYKVKDNRILEEALIMDELAKYGIEINIPKDEKETKKEKKDKKDKK